MQPTGVIFCFEQAKTSARRAEGRGGGSTKKKWHIVFALLPTRLTRTSRRLVPASVKLKKRNGKITHVLQAGIGDCFSNFKAHLKQLCNLIVIHYTYWETNQMSSRSFPE